MNKNCNIYATLIFEVDQAKIYLPKKYLQRLSRFLVEYFQFTIGLGKYLELTCAFFEVNLKFLSEKDSPKCIFQITKPSNGRAQARFYVGNLLAKGRSASHF